MRCPFAVDAEEADAFSIFEIVFGNGGVFFFSVLMVFVEDFQHHSVERIVITAAEPDGSPAVASTDAASDTLGFHFAAEFLALVFLFLFDKEYLFFKHLRMYRSVISLKVRIP